MRIDHWYTLPLAALLALAISACGGEDAQEDPAGDMNVVIILDDMEGGTTPAGEMGADMDETTDPPDLPEEMGGGDMGVDMPEPDMKPDEDRDDDGILNDEDNCPDAANPDQRDRDRDGLGDTCDAFRNYHDPDNPTSLEELLENEEVNDDAAIAEDLGTTLPFAGTGIISPPEGETPDIDFWSIEVDGPTNLLVEVNHAAPLGLPSTSFQPAALITGYETRSVNVFRVGLSPVQGRGFVREVFLPVAGKYTIGVSHITNFINTQPNRGNTRWTYTLRASELPLPEPEEVIQAPSPPKPHIFSGPIKVWEISGAATLGALRAQLNPSSLGGGDAPFFQPVLTIYDPDAGETLAHSSADYINADDVATLDTFVSQQRQRLWVIEEYIQRDESVDHNLVFSASTPDLSEEAETVDAPLDDRADPLIWLDGLARVEGAIDQPRGTTPDEDVYLFTMSRGEVVEVTLSSPAGGNLVPDVRLGHAWSQNGNASFFDLQRREPRDDDVPGQPRAVSFLVSAAEEGELAVKIAHDDHPASGPVGGGAYSYTLDFERLDSRPVDLGTVPSGGMVDIAAGGSGLVKFSVAAGAVFSANITEDQSLFLNQRLLDADFNRLQRTFESTVIGGAPADDSAEFYLDIRDYDGAPSPMPIALDITTATVQDFGALGSAKSDVLDTMGEDDFWRVQVPAGEVFDLRVLSEEFFPDVDIYDAETFERVASTTRGTALILEEPSTLIVRVSSFDDARDAQQIYTLGMRTVAPTPLGATPATASGTIDTPPFGTWYEADVTTGDFYSLVIDADASGFSERARVMRADDLRYIDATSSGQSRWRAEFDGKVYILAYDSQNRAGMDFDYTIALDTFTPVPGMLGQPITGQLSGGTEEAIYSVTLPSFGALTLDVVPQGWAPRIRVLNPDSLNTINGRQTLETWAYADSETTDVLISVRSEDASATGPLDFTLTATHTPETPATAEVEPNDDASPQQLSALPAIIAGEMQDPDLVDVFSVQARAGERLWLMSAARNGSGLYDFDPELELIAPSGNRVASNRYGGEGFYPAVYGAPVTEDGTYIIRLDGTRDTSIIGEYTLYVLAGDLFEVSEVEPNDTLMAPQDIGLITQGARASITADMQGSADVLRFEIPSTSDVNISLGGGAADGFEFRLYDDTMTEIAASGAAINGVAQPSITVAGAAPGVYFLEVAPGTATGAAEVVLQRN